LSQEGLGDFVQVRRRWSGFLQIRSGVEVFFESEGCGGFLRVRRGWGVPFTQEDAVGFCRIRRVWGVPSSHSESEGGGGMGAGTFSKEGGQEMNRIVTHPNHETKMVLLYYRTVFAQNPGWAVLTQTIVKSGNSGWAMPTQIISRVGTCPLCPPGVSAHGWGVPSSHSESEGGGLFPSSQEGGEVPSCQV